MQSRLKATQISIQLITDISQTEFTYKSSRQLINIAYSFYSISGSNFTSQLLQVVEETLAPCITLGKILDLLMCHQGFKTTTHSCESLMLSATKAYICAAFMARAGTTDTSCYLSIMGKLYCKGEKFSSPVGKPANSNWQVCWWIHVDRVWYWKSLAGAARTTMPTERKPLRSAGNDDEMTAISSPAQQPYSSGMSINNTLTYSTMLCVWKWSIKLHYFY